MEVTALLVHLSEREMPTLRKVGHHEFTMDSTLL